MMNAYQKQMLSIVVILSILFGHAAGAEEKIMTIGLIGDSTVATTYGWGPSFAAQCNDRAKVLNFARNGATLDSLSQKLDVLLKQKPDYVLIQFGHNDMKRYDTESYSTKLKVYVKKVMAAGATPIVLSSVTRRNFDGNGKVEPRVINNRTLHDYSLAARAVAQKAKVTFIDLYAVSLAHHNKIGPDASAAYNPTADDTTHFNQQGAKAIASLIIKELKTAAPKLAAFTIAAPE